MSYDSDVAEMKAAVDAPATGPVLAAARDIEKSIAHLGEVLHGLARRLDPLLRPDEPRPDRRAADAPQDGGSQLANGLRRHVGELADLRVRVEQLLDRIEV